MQTDLCRLTEAIPASHWSYPGDPPHAQAWEDSVGIVVYHVSGSNGINTCDSVSVSIRWPAGTTDFGGRYSAEELRLPNYIPPVTTLFRREPVGHSLHEATFELWAAGYPKAQGGDDTMVLRAYLDSSGDPSGHYLTLAAFFGPDDIWHELDTEWAKILNDHSPPASYVHMRELAHLRNGFGGPEWARENAFGLVFKCLGTSSTWTRENLE